MICCEKKRSGTPNLQVSMFTRHKGTKEHMWAAQSLELKQTKSTEPQIIEKHTDNNLDDNDVRTVVLPY